MMRAANSALALRYKALLVHKAVPAHKDQQALRVPPGRKVQLAQLGHKAQPERKAHRVTPALKVQPERKDQPEQLVLKAQLDQSQQGQS